MAERLRVHSGRPIQEKACTISERPAQVMPCTAEALHSPTSEDLKRSREPERAIDSHTELARASESHRESNRESLTGRHK